MNRTEKYLEFTMKLRGYNFYTSQNTFVPRWELFFGGFKASDLLEGRTRYRKVERIKSRNIKKRDF